MIFPRRLVAQNDDGLIEMADYHVYATVIVQVAQSNAPAGVQVAEIIPGFGRNVGKAAISPVAQQEGALLPWGIAFEKVIRVAVDKNQVLPATVFHIDESSSPTDVRSADHGT